MKKLFFLLLVILTSQNFYAQRNWFTRERINNDATGGKGNIDDQILTWGYFLGFNSYDFKFEYVDQDQDSNTDIIVENQVGFNVGLIGDLKLNNYINLRLEPGLYVTNRDLIFPKLIGGEEEDFLRETQSTYIHVPLLVKFSTKRLNNFKPFVVGGVSTSLNLSSNQDNPEDNLSGQFRMTKNSYYYELGFGIDFYLYYFKFTPSIRGVFALKNEIVPDDASPSPYTDNIARMETRAIFINFTFQ